MSRPSMRAVPCLTIGLDLGDKISRLCLLEQHSLTGEEASMPTTRAGLTRHFGGRPRCRVVLDVGIHSPWVSRELTALGHEVYVANPSAMYGARRRRKRNDRLDAEYLAR